MAKYKATVNYQGSVDIYFDADSDEEAKAQGYIKFDEVSAREIEAGVCDISVGICEIEDDEESSDSLDQ